MCFIFNKSFNKCVLYCLAGKTIGIVLVNVTLILSTEQNTRAEIVAARPHFFSPMLPGGAQSLSGATDVRVPSAAGDVAGAWRFSTVPRRG